MTATPANFVQTVSLRDLRGFTGRVRSVWHNVDQSVNTPSVYGDHIVEAISNLTNAVVFAASGPFYQPVTYPITYGGSSEFANVEDVMHLIFTADGTNQLVKVSIPAPLEANFLTTDKRTVNAANTNVAAFINLALAVTQTGLYLISPTSLQQVTSYVTGYRKRVKNDRRRVTNYTIGKP